MPATNGLRSLSAHIGNDYVRVRIGVGHPGVKELVIKWVLNDFSKADQEWLSIRSSMPSRHRRDGWRVATRPAL